MPSVRQFPTRMKRNLVEVLVLTPRNFADTISADYSFYGGIMTATSPQVLTLEETAAYLRLPAELVEQEAIAGHIPGRQINDHWQFVKTAIDQWLQNRKEASIEHLSQENPWIEFAGVFKDDPDFAKIAAAIRAEREVEDDTEVDPSVYRLEA